MTICGYRKPAFLAVISKYVCLGYPHGFLSILGWMQGGGEVG